MKNRLYQGNQEYINYDTYEIATLIGIPDALTLL